MYKLICFLLEIFSDLIYPSNIYCVCCGNIIDDSRPYSLCDSCVRTMNWANDQICRKCGKILRPGYGHELCTDCNSISHHFERGFACVEYGRAERELIHNFKYKEKAYLGQKLGDIMYDRIIPENLNIDLIIPVPMFKKKQKTRGYNQASILAKRLARLMDKPFYSNILLRVIDTEPMSSLGAEERRDNIKNAFKVNEVKHNVAFGKSILLIDDIYTTGSTADACAVELLAAGAHKVYILVFAAGANI